MGSIFAEVGPSQVRDGQKLSLNEFARDGIKEL
jgi:hypothetical protein